MIRAVVVGKTWASVKSPGLEKRKLLLLAPCDKEGRPGKKIFVAADSVSCGEGQEVLLSFGSAARNALENQALPIEATVVGILANQ